MLVLVSLKALLEGVHEQFQQFFLFLTVIFSQSQEVSLQKLKLLQRVFLSVL